MHSRLACFVMLCAMIAGTIASGATQTDWSDGSVNSGPVAQWESVFDNASGISWRSIPGQLSLSSTPMTETIEHMVVSNYNGASSSWGCDVDQDGDVDLLATGWNEDEMAWWSNNGSSPIQWSKHVIGGDLPGARSAEACDLDGDGDVDVVGAVVDTDEIIWFRNNGGNPILWEKFPISASLEGAHDTAVNDIDGDGDLDVIGTGCMNDKVCWWEVSEYISEGELISSILDTGTPTESAGLEWSAILPNGSGIHFNLRSSENPEAMGEWSQAITIPGDTGLNLKRYVQYKVVLDSTDPAVSSILEDLTVIVDSTPKKMEITLLMPASSYGEEDIFSLDLAVNNFWYSRDADLYILLDIFGQYWCYPSWISLTEGLDHMDFSISAGQNSILMVIPGFIMPPISPSGPFYFYAAMFEDGTLSGDSLSSNVDLCEFSFE